MSVAKMNFSFQFVFQIILMLGLYGRTSEGLAFKFATSILSLLSLYGLFSFVAAWSEIKVDITYLGNVVGACLIVFWIFRWVTRIKETRSVDTAELPVFAINGMYVVLICGVCLCLGTLSYGLELTPSSMTGDPPRHFARALIFIHEDAAAMWKPIYPLTVAGWLLLTTQFDPVSCFTLLNVLVLGGIAVLMYWMLCEISPAIQGYRAFCAACLAVAGYPYFALQYGYFALNLAAMYFFATMLVLLQWTRNRNLQTYMLSIILGTGLVLTHGYLLPPLLIMQSTIFFHTRIFENQKSVIAHSPLKLSWLIYALSWYVVLSMLSNGWISIDGLGGQLDTLKMRGFVNESFFPNVAPFLPLAALNLFFYKQSRQTRILTYVALFVLLYATLLLILGFFGLMAPYYVNRVQVILLPLLVVLNAIVIYDLSRVFRVSSTTFFTIALLGVIGLYWGYHRMPLQFAKENFLSLLRKDEFVYHENARNAGFSPLQLTPLDVRLLKAIRQDHRICFDQPMTKVPVLGTDHSTQWFEHLTGIRPSLFDRTDGYIDFRDYLRNFNIWLKSPHAKYIVVTSHFDFWSRGDILAKISNMASPVCTGGSITIYRKNSPIGEARR